MQIVVEGILNLCKSIDYMFLACFHIKIHKAYLLPFDPPRDSSSGHYRCKGPKGAIERVDRKGEEREKITLMLVKLEDSWWEGGRRCEGTGCLGAV